MSIVRILMVDNVVWMCTTIATEVCGHCIVKLFRYVFLKRK